MANTNFHQSLGSSAAPEKKQHFLSKGIYISFGIIALFLLIWGGVAYYDSFQKGKIENLTQSISAEAASLDQDSLIRVASFENGLKKIKEVIFSRTVPVNISNDQNNEFFREVEDAMVPGAVATNLVYSGGGLSISIDADNFQVVAKQIKSMKDSPYFNSRLLKVVDSERTEEGKINFTVEVPIK